MWLENGTSTALRLSTLGSTSKEVAPNIGDVALRAAPPRGSVTLDATIDHISDGVRILEQVLPVAPLQLAHLHHLQLKSRLEVLQSWEGIVIDIDEERGEFKARLSDLTNRGGDESEAIFDKRDVGANEIDLLRVGGIFQWLVGYRKHSYGQMERVSAIVFRRLPAWHAEDLARAQSEGEAIAAAFGAD